ncbi:unnamed protein product [Diamesa tonsa]
MMKILLFLSLFVVDNVLSVNARVEKDWWQKTIFYQIYPRSFQDSNGDGIGDLQGIILKLKHLKESGVGATWLSPIFKSPMVDFGYDISDFTAIQPEYGTMEDFDELIVKAKDLDIKIILDFVPNHSSDQCEWFIKSEARDPIYEDFYIWRDGKNINGKLEPPNNWVSVFYGPAWTWSEKRQQFYLHQFTKQQPDLNYRNSKVIKTMQNVLRFWLAKGVSGFRVDAVNHLFEAEDLRDEPKTSTDPDPLSYGYLNHWFTKDLPEVYDIVYQWREVLDDWQVTYGGETRIMMTEAYANITYTMKYYESDDGKRKGSHLPFNFLLISDLNKDSTAQDFVHTISKWMNFMPAGETANWVLGNHDKPRFGSRYGTKRIDGLLTLLMTLPGVAVTYNGDEIGMLDYRDISWEDTLDPQGCNVGPENYKWASRDPQRTPFQWDSTDYAGFKEAAGKKPWIQVHPDYKTNNLALQKAAPKSFYKFYKQLSALRKNETLMYGDFKSRIVNEHVFTYTRTLEDEEQFLVLINFSDKDVEIDINTLGVNFNDNSEVVLAGSMSSYEAGQTVKNMKFSLKGYDSIILMEKSGASIATLSLLCFFTMFIKMFL